ncbi:J domain-containing protein [Sphingomonas humi]|uniref:J domain-containing protein n=1 Tax=Sphingomonas humi TaxID=335630 RepID=A0ABP7RF39_9SPHN
MTNHYRTLGVDPNADPASIRSAYLALIRRYHPDTGGDADAARAQSVTAAWDVLRDPARRAAYDETQQARFTPGGAVIPASRARGGVAARNTFLLLAAATLGLGWWALQQPHEAPPTAVAATAPRANATPIEPPAIRPVEDAIAAHRQARVEVEPPPVRPDERLAIDLPLKPPLPTAEPLPLPIETATRSAAAPHRSPANAATRVPAQPPVQPAREEPRSALAAAPLARIDLAPLERHLQLLTDQSLRFGTEAKRSRLLATRETFAKRLQDCRDDGCRRDTYLKRNMEVAEIMRN